jgi:hypothetical protein
VQEWELLHLSECGICSKPTSKKLKNCPYLYLYSLRSIRVKASVIFNWSPSYEQYKQQVGNLQENQDDLYETIEGMQEEIKELNRQITNLRIAVQ